MKCRVLLFLGTALWCGTWNAVGADPSKAVAQGSSPQTTVNRAVVSTSIGEPTMTCTQRLTDAEAKFLQNDYDGALSQVNAALTQCPNDLAIHEMRALVMFAKGEFQEASKSAHLVVASGRTWNWAALYRHYDGVATYTAQLRALEAFTRKHPDDGPARFLQAYHYMVDGFPDAAARELQMVIRLEANDRIAAETLKSLGTVTSR